MRERLALIVDDAAAHGFDRFVEGCEQVKTPAQVRGLLAEAAQRAGFRAMVLATHGPAEEFAPMGVRAHNLKPAASAAFFADDARPLFALAGASTRAFSWRAQALAAKARAGDRAWWEAIAAAGLCFGVTQSVRTPFTPASCTLIGAGESGELARARWVMRAAAYGFHHILALQRPRLVEADMLTARERQCMLLAALAGLRPREVARALGVSVNTVRTMRQRACLRLGARNQEEAVWRMLATGQLFCAARALPGGPR